MNLVQKYIKFNFKLDLFQVTLSVSDIHLRLCKPKEQIHWAKKHLRILKDILTNKSD